MGYKEEDEDCTRGEKICRRRKKAVLTSRGGETRPRSGGEGDRREEKKA